MADKLELGREFQPLAAVFDDLPQRDRRGCRRLARLALSRRVQDRRFAGWIFRTSVRSKNDDRLRSSVIATFEVAIALNLECSATPTIDRPVLMRSLPDRCRHNLQDSRGDAGGRGQDVENAVNEIAGHLSRLFRRLQPVAYSGERGDQGGRFLDIAQLLAHSAHPSLQVVSLIPEFRTPDPHQQLGMEHDPSGMAGELVPQLSLRPAEMYLLLGDRDAPLLQIVTCG